MLAILGIILLVALIVLIIRLNFTLSKIDMIIDDFQGKLNRVNKAIETVDRFSNSLSLVNDRMVDAIASVISKIFSFRKKKVEKEEEEEF
jgi:uncharacterized protein YoxC